MNVPQGLPQDLVSDVSFLYTRFRRIHDNLTNWHSIPRAMKIRAIEASLEDFGTAYACFQAVMNELMDISSVLDKKANPMSVVRRELFQHYCTTWRTAAEVLMADGLLPSLVHRMREVVDLNPSVTSVITLRRVKEKIHIQELANEAQKLEAQRILGALRSFNDPKEVGLTTRGHLRLLAMLHIAKDFEKCIKSLHRRIKQYCDDYAEKPVPKPPRPPPPPPKAAAKGPNKSEAWWNIGQAM